MTTNRGGRPAIGPQRSLCLPAATWADIDHIAGTLGLSRPNTLRRIIDAGLKVVRHPRGRVVRSVPELHDLGATVAKCGRRALVLDDHDQVWSVEIVAGQTVVALLDEPVQDDQLVEVWLTKADLDDLACVALLRTSGPLRVIADPEAPRG